VKGREIWGKLLPYGEIWRGGANEPTLFTFSDDVMIEGKKLAAGTYRFVTIPGPKEWTVIFNSETKNWGTVYEPQYDTLRFTVTPETDPHEEWLSYSFTDLTPSSAQVVLAWEKMRIGFKIEFNTLAKIQASVGNWQILNGSAGYALTQKIYLNEAMDWVDRSIALDKNPRNLRTKAELLAQAGKPEEAIATAEEAVKLSKQRDPKANTSALEKLISDWKEKK
jgi:tetratricopeptide (TPR) repeat protein